MDDIEITAVVPAFNEGENIPRLCEVLTALLTKNAHSYEVIIVDDGSSDGTSQAVKDIRSRDSRVRLIELSRNFGKESAMTAGMSLARGKAVLLLDADLQHPPHLIPDMINAWREGSEVVNAVKRSRGGESIVYRMFSHLFNRMVSAAIGRDMNGASDFKLLDRQVVDALLDCPERHRFFRGLVAWVGFRVREIEFDVADRYAGESKWSSRALIRYSLTNLVAFSSMPLRMVAAVGFATVGLGAVLLAQTFIRYFMGGAAIGFTTVIAVQVMLGGMLLLAIGVVAVYIAQLYDESKQRPLFIVRAASSEWNITIERERKSASFAGGRQ